MAQHRLPESESIRMLHMLAQHGGNVTATSAALGIPRNTLQARLRVARALGLDDNAPRVIADEARVAPAPDPNEPIESLLERKRAGMKRAQEFEDWAKLIDIQVKRDGPIGVLLVGDPHVDDDHCDIARLEADLSRVRSTPGFFAGHLGDLTNNWVGRLARLYASQSTTFGDALRLANGCLTWHRTCSL